MFSSVGLLECNESGQTAGAASVCFRKAQADLHLIRSPEQMAEIGRYNAEYAREHFMASKVAARLQKIYNEVMAGYV